MKKRILTLFLAGALAICGTVSASAKPAASQSEEASEEETKTIGTPDEKGFQFLITNGTGKDIQDIRVIITGRDTFEDVENLLEEGDVFEKEEQRQFCYTPPEDEETEEADSQADDGLPTMYDVQLVFEDETTAVLHTFPFGDIEEGEIGLEEGIAYMMFESLFLKQEINSLGTEKDILEKEKAAQAPVPSTDSSYSGGAYYEDSGSGSSAPPAAPPAQTDGGGQDVCLEGGLLF